MANKASDATVTEEPTTMTPGQLAEELGINPKSLRSYLRSNFPRSDEAHNSRWTIDEALADAVRDHYLGDDNDDEDSEVEEVEV